MRQAGKRVGRALEASCGRHATANHSNIEHERSGATLGPGTASHRQGSRQRQHTHPVLHLVLQQAGWRAGRQGRALTASELSAAGRSPSLVAGDAALVVLLVILPPHPAKRGRDCPEEGAVKSCRKSVSSPWRLRSSFHNTLRAERSRGVQERRLIGGLASRSGAPITRHNPNQRSRYPHPVAG